MGRVKNQNLKTRDGLYIESSGFTLIETLLATAILTIAIVGALSLITQSTTLTGSVRNEHIAANLAQEGVELVQNIRTTNWVVDRVWNVGISDGAFVVDVSTSPVVLTPTSCGSAATNLYQKVISGTSMYVHDNTGSATIFSRCITIASAVDADGVAYIRVRSTVGWNNASLTAEDHLYNWK